MSKIPKILPATKFSFCPDGHKLFRTMWTGPSYGILLTTMHKPCLDFLWMNSLSVFSTLYQASSKLL